LAATRDALAIRTGRPVTFGWGPRFLHSTGQYHKGGPPTGVFLQVTGDPEADLAVPDRPFTFHEFLTAQAVGDGQVLAEHGRPVLRLHVSSPGDLGVVRSVLSGRSE
jgi:glucose-6-phosphate isomerase